MDNSASWLIIFVYSFICAGLTSFLASEKNRNTGNWFIIGLLFGILGLIAAAGVPKAKNVKQITLKNISIETNNKDDKSETDKKDDKSCAVCGCKINWTVSYSKVDGKNICWGCIDNYIKKRVENT